MENLKEAERMIMKAGTIVVAGHVSPDGDCIGSMLSLAKGLEKLGKKVYRLSSDGVPKKYKDLPGAKKIVRELHETVDLAISVDCSARHMLGPAYEVFSRAQAILEIDHHQVRASFGDLALVDPKAAAVGEIVFILLKGLDVEITKEIAENILTSIIVETSSFRLPNVRPFTFKVSAELVEKGVNFYSLVDEVFWSYSKEAAVLSGISLSRLKFMEDGKLAWSVIRRKDFEATGGKDEDVDPVADEIRAIKEVKIVIYFREKDKETLRVSLRSKNSLNVARLAERYGGGGHCDVAGCLIPNTPKAMKELLAQAQELLKG